MKHKPCATCHGTGWLICHGPQLQRCDECCRFRGDLTAAQAFFRSKEGRHYWLDSIRIRARGEPRGKPIHGANPYRQQEAPNV